MQKHNKVMFYWVALMLALDQLSKWWISQHFFPGMYGPVAPFLNIGLFYNNGAAFSLLAEHRWARWLFLSLALLASFWLLGHIRQASKQQRWQAFAYAMILAGALGNAIDRLLRGVVIDFLDFHIHSWHWPAFNLADTWICVGVGLLLLIQLRKA